jgi:methionyl-tRNA formyltransferase
LINLSNALLIDYLPKYVSGEVKLRLQPHPSRATYSRKLTKQDGLIDWRKSARQIEREIRAFTDWPKSQTKLVGKEVILLNTHVEDKTGPAGQVFTEAKKLGVYCGEAALIIDILKPAGKNKMTSQAFLAGHRNLLDTA